MVGSKRIPWYLLSPTIIILLIVGLLPFIYVLIVSFYNWIKKDGGYSWLTFPTYVKDMYNSGRGYNSWKLQTDYMYHNEKLLIDKIFLL